MMCENQTTVQGLLRHILYFLSLSFPTEVLGLVADSVRNILCTLSVTKLRTSIWRPAYHSDLVRKLQRRMMPSPPATLVIRTHQMHAAATAPSLYIYIYIYIYIYRYILRYIYRNYQICSQNGFRVVHLANRFCVNRRKGLNL